MRKGAYTCIVYRGWNVRKVRMQRYQGCSVFKGWDVRKVRMQHEQGGCLIC